eukprot:gene20419-27203_t
MNTGELATRGKSLSPWSKKEEFEFATRHSMLGDKWRAIAKFLPDRSLHEITKHWGCAKRSTKSNMKAGALLCIYAKRVESGHPRPESLAKAMAGLAATALPGYYHRLEQKLEKASKAAIELTKATEELEIARGASAPPPLALRGTKRSAPSKSENCHDQEAHGQDVTRPAKHAKGTSSSLSMLDIYNAMAAEGTTTPCQLPQAATTGGGEEQARYLTGSFRDSIHRNLCWDAPNPLPLVLVTTQTYLLFLVPLVAAFGIANFAEMLGPIPDMGLLNDADEANTEQAMQFGGADEYACAEVCGSPPTPEAYSECPIPEADSKYTTSCDSDNTLTRQLLPLEGDISVLCNYTHEEVWSTSDAGKVGPAKEQSPTLYPSTQSTRSCDSAKAYARQCNDKYRRLIKMFTSLLHMRTYGVFYGSNTDNDTPAKQQSHCSAGLYPIPTFFVNGGDDKALLLALGDRAWASVGPS